MTAGIGDGAASARIAGLHYSTDDAPGFVRRRHGRGFVYRTPSGQVVRSREILKRIRALVLPPAWRDVWISVDPLSHLQATGRDAAGRKQYRYHPSWTAVRDSTKFYRLLAFGQALPRIRRRAARDARKPRLSRDQVLATVVQILERTNIRVGNEEYVRANGSHGLTTLRNRHVRIGTRRIRFAFRAKSGVMQRIDLDDARLAAAVRACQDLPGQTLFQYRDDEQAVRSISSADLNAYLREAAGDEFTAKDFRTWAGTLLAARALDEIGVAATKTAAAKSIVQAVDRVAATLGNTRAVSRRGYIHPAVLASYENGTTLESFAPRDRARPAGLSRQESRLLALLRAAQRTERTVLRRAA
jgi:DNA topoisomerase-1